MAPEGSPSLPAVKTLSWIGFFARGVGRFRTGCFRSVIHLDGANQFGSGRSSDISTGTAFGWSAAICEF